MNGFEERASVGGVFSQCAYCAHDQGNSQCPAFPNGIPQGILDNIVDHRQPYHGDHGIRWEPYEPGAKHPMDEVKE